MTVAYVRVEVDLSDIDTDDLVQELEGRDDAQEHLEQIVGGESLTLIMRRLFEAFYTGKDAKAIELARKAAEMATGRMLP